MALSPFAAQAATGVLEQVIVEAQKKSENVQDTPIAISAISGSQFQQTAGFNLADIARNTAGLSFDTGVQVDIHLRGTSTVANGPVSPRTNLYVDGALIDQPRATFAAQYDIAAFEILKGPQGTLYGKSSPTGTINIRTQNPSLNKVDGYVSGSAGQRDLANTQFAVGLPIIEDELAVRLAAVYDTSKTGVESVTSGVDATNRTSAMRFTTLWQPNNDFTARASYTYTENATDPIYVINHGQGLRYYQDKATTNYKDHDYFRDQLTVVELTYNINDHLSVTSVTGYEVQHFTDHQDSDGTASDYPNLPYNNLRDGNKQNVGIEIQPSYQEDLRLASEDNDFWDWQVGGYYKNSTSNTPLNIKTYNTGVAVSLESNLILKQEEYAAYTHNTFKFTDEFNLIVGLRAQRFRANSTQPTNACSMDGNAPADCPTNPGNFVGSFPLISAQGIPSKYQFDYEQPITGTIKAQYFFNVDLAGYISVDRAYRTGTANLNLQGNLPSDFAFTKPESANSLEAGLKGSFWDQRASFTLSVFDQVYKNFQQDIQTVPVVGGQNANNFIVNAKEAEIRGVEGEVRALVLDGWQLAVSMTYNDAKFNDFKNNPCAGSTQLTPDHAYNSCDLSGEDLPAAPRWTGVVSSNYSLPAFDGADWYFNTLLNAKSDQVDKLTRSTLGGYATMDFFTGLRASENGTWDINLWLKNAFDRRVVTSIHNATEQNPALLATSPTGGFEMVNTNAPRQAGITGTYRF